MHALFEIIALVGLLLAELYPEETFNESPSDLVPSPASPASRHRLFAGWTLGVYRKRLADGFRWDSPASRT